MDGFEYRCILGGTPNDTSEAATLTVLNIPVVSISPADTMFCEGDSALLTATSGGTAQWYKNGSAIAGATSNTLWVFDEGVYNMVKTNTNQCSDRAATGVVVTIDPCNPGGGGGAVAVAHLLLWGMKALHYGVQSPTQAPACSILRFPPLLLHCNCSCTTLVGG